MGGPLAGTIETSMGELPIAIANVVIGHAFWMWIIPMRESGLARFKRGCARAALIGLAIAVAYGIYRIDEGFFGVAVFGLTLVGAGTLAGGILSAVWRQQAGSDSPSV